jgi:nucleotide-binding universal stress UspA family protein
VDKPQPQSAHARTHALDVAATLGHRDPCNEQSKEEDVPIGNRTQVKRLVIATDGSDDSRAAIESGIELARAAGAATSVVYVRPAPRRVIGDKLHERRVEAEVLAAWTAIDEAVEHAADVGVEMEAEVLEGEAGEQILQLARERQADLIVVGSRGLGPVGRAVHGSVSHSVVHDADRPVLVVKRQAAPGRQAA